MSEWKEVRLGDLCYRVCSGGTPKSTCSVYYDGGTIPWLNTKEINYNRIYQTESHITEEGLNNSSAKWIDANSVIVAMYGATAGRVAVAKIPMTTNQACCNLMIDKSKADYNFIYYYLSNNYKHLLSMANGAAQQNLNAQVIKDFVISLPEIGEQHRISSFLSALDDKIAVNRRICENLEAQAQALFKHWFIDFAPFKNGQFVESELGMIPEGWRVGKLEDLGRIICGKTPSKTKKSYYGGDVPFIKIPDMHGNVFILKSEDNLSIEGSNSQSNKLIPEFSIMVSCIATVGLVAMNVKPSHTNQQINTIVPYQSCYRYYVYENLKLKNKELLMLGSSGTTTYNVNTRTFSSLKILVPELRVFEDYNNVIKFHFEKILNLYQESSRLSTLRDTLLPKLMSGQIKVNEIEKGL